MALGSFRFLVSIIISGSRNIPLLLGNKSHLMGRFGRISPGLGHSNPFPVCTTEAMDIGGLSMFLWPEPKRRG